MTSNTLDALGRAILEVIEERNVTAETLELHLDTSENELGERLSQLVDNGLVRAENDEYELTENGQRLLTATPAGTRDNRIDTPSHIEQAISDFSLRPDETDAVRTACAFLRYWGEATTAELIDGTYSEVPAGYDTADRWWDDCVSDHLENLPDIRFVSDELPTGQWTYGDDAIIETSEDGRNVDLNGLNDRGGGGTLDKTASSTSPFGSVRHGIESLDLREPERTAIRVAFGVLFERRRVSAEELTQRVYDTYPTGYQTLDEWIAWVKSIFAELPGIETETEAGTVYWNYSPSGDGV